MKLYDVEFKDELKVTKADAKQIRYSDTSKSFVLGKDENNTLYIDKHFNFGVVGLKTIADCGDKDRFKWTLTDKLKQGDVVKSVDYKIYKSLCVFDKRDRFGMSWCWEIYNKRPKEIRCDEYMYKLVERE
jgi:hypothetical protein